MRNPTKFSGPWNFGPDAASQIPVEQVVRTVLELWGSGDWEDVSRADAPYEASALALDCERAHSRLAWKPVWDVTGALKASVEWYQAESETDFDGPELARRQLEQYSSAAREAGVGWAQPMAKTRD